MLLLWKLTKLYHCDFCSVCTRAIRMNVRWYWDGLTRELKLNYSGKVLKQKDLKFQATHLYLPWPPWVTWQEKDGFYLCHVTPGACTITVVIYRSSYWAGVFVPCKPCSVCGWGQERTLEWSTRKLLIKWLYDCHKKKYWHVWKIIVSWLSDAYIMIVRWSHIDHKIIRWL